MQIITLRYSHRFGEDIYSWINSGPMIGLINLPEITNELLEELDIDNPELEREDEDAYWTITDGDDLEFPKHLIENNG